MKPCFIGIAAVLALSSTGVHAAPAEYGPFKLETAANSFDERCVKLGAGQSLRYRFTASVPVDFNIHYHRGDDVFYPVKKTAITTRAGRLRAKTAEVYCLMWENRGEDSVTVSGSIDPGPR
jgi:hypothetical protein